MCVMVDSLRKQHAMNVDDLGNLRLSWLQGIYKNALADLRMETESPRLELT